MSESIYDFWTAAAGGSPLEWVAVVTGFACVWLAARESLWNFPVAIVSCGLYVVVYYRAGLYSDCLSANDVHCAEPLRLVPVAVRRAEPHGVARIAHHPRGSGLAARPSWRPTPLGVGYYLQHYTDAALPHWDAFTTAGSLAAQYLLMRKRLENWLLWVVVDIIYVPILWYKHLYPTSALYALYLGLAVYGYVEWRRALRRTAAAAPCFARLPDCCPCPISPCFTTHLFPPADVARCPYRPRIDGQNHPEPPAGRPLPAPPGCRSTPAHYLEQHGPKYTLGDLEQIARGPAAGRGSSLPQARPGRAGRWCSATPTCW